MAPILTGIHPAHLARADADGLAVARVNNGIRFHVLGNFPGEIERGAFFVASAAAWF